jgi:ADP-ribosylglycohydrolase
VTSIEREKAVVGSALWAAAGDAIGWITELGDEGTVRHRTGETSVSRTVEWRRRIGGKFGPTVKLPAGTYSDDTQLRLAVSRATGPTGAFDAEAFAKIELPVWGSYSLGAGRGSSAAAANLSKTSVSWFNNFFGPADGRNYFSGGGNGAAMRTQPHVWKADPARPDTFLPDVLRDAVITHGHPKGIGGAVFHALCVAHALREGSVPGLEDWRSYIQHLEYCESIIQSDDKLGLFWLRSWEGKAGHTLGAAFAKEIAQAQHAINLISEIADNPSRYEDVLQSLGCFDEATRGAGIATALAAAILANYVKIIGEEDALLIAANTLNSDTDTIASMAGAIFGCCSEREMTWDVQDRDYIISEARRMVGISEGKRVSAFHYPDLLSWVPPSTQSDAVGFIDGKLFLAGLGALSVLGEEYATNDAIWQWGALPFGQTILTKRRRNPRKLTVADAPLVPAPLPISQPIPPVSRRPDFFSIPSPSAKGERSDTRRGPEPDIERMDLDGLTAFVIDNGFTPVLIGRIMIMLGGTEDGIERSIAFAAIIAKALKSRRRRNG